MPDNTPENMPVRPVQRGLILDDIHVRQDGDGRTVEAYAAVFKTRSEIRDQDGHYHEELDRGSFTRTIQHKGPNGFGVLFNHGRTVDGAPNPMATMPIGVPVDVKADEKGVWTATRYLENPLAEDVLQAIKAGALKAQSFSGRFLRSVRSYPDGRGRMALPVVTRMEVDMREYGPAVFAAYGEAAILGTRSLGLSNLEAALGQPPSIALQLFTRALLAMPYDEALLLLQQYETGTTLPMTSEDTEPATLTTPEEDEPGTGDKSADEPPAGHSERMAEFRNRYANFKAHLPK